MRKATYGDRLRELDRQQDDAYWQRRYENALRAHDYAKIEMLLEEARDEDFDIPLTKDPRILEMIHNLKK